MVQKGTSYDHGRLGVEIAYAIANHLFQIRDFSIPEPSKGGRDLYTSDGRIAIQARLICDFRQFRPIGMKEAVKAQLKSLLRKLGQDFAFNPKMSLGLASLSYLDEVDGKLRTILVSRGRRRGSIS